MSTPYPAKTRALMVKASQSALLCFDVEGILGEMDVQLGSATTAFGFAAFYANLGVTRPLEFTVPVEGRPPQQIPADPSRLLYDSAGIYGGPIGRTGFIGVQAFRLAALRAEATKAALDSAINSRQNSYLKKYTATAAIIAQMTSSYSAAAGANSKPSLLAQLAKLSQNQADLLTGAYSTDARTGVVRSTSSILSSQTTSQSKNWVSEGAVTTNQSATINTAINAYTPDGLPEAAMTVAGGVPATLTQNLSYTNQAVENYSNYPTVTTDWNAQAYPAGITSEILTFPAPTTAVTQNTQITLSSGTASVEQGTQNTDYGYRVPYIENLAQNARAQISLLDEQFSQFLFGVQIPSLQTILNNELASIDLGVKQLQVAYLNTILMSPISGVVTGVYKNVGERVKAGEPVLRVENNSAVLLVGTLIYDGPIPITTSGPGSNVSVSTSLLGSQVTIAGTVIAVRGHKTQEDEWDVVVSCNNTSAVSSTPIFPLNYQFDCDDTTITVS